MKKLLILLLLSNLCFAQTLKTTIDNNIYNQGVKGITATKLRNTFNVIVDSVKTYLPINNPRATGKFTITNSNNQAAIFSTYQGSGSAGQNLWAGNGGISNTSGGFNSAFGINTLYSITTGSFNSAIGANSLQNTTTGSTNSGIGNGTLQYNTSGGSNSAIGAYSLNSNTTGSNNISLGTYSLYSNTTGNNNIGIGKDAGRYATAGYVSNVTSSSSIYIGVDARPSADGNTNEIVLGNGTVGNGSNSVTLGNASITKTILIGSVGIGSASPTSPLQVVSLPTYASNSAAITGGLTIGAFYKTSVGVLMVVY